MTTTRRIAITLAVAAFLVSAAAAIGALAPRQPAAERTQAHQPKPGRSFRISGFVEDLHPGASAPLRLKLQNPHRFKIVVRKLKVGVGDAAGGCSASNVTIPRFKGRLHLAHSKLLTLPVAMSPAAPSSCQNAIFPLTYRGKAKAKRR